MSKTDVFYDEYNDSAMAEVDEKGRVVFITGGAPWLSKEQSIELANQIISMCDGDTANTKREAINELLALHKQDRAKVNSQCDTVINMSTIEKYLEGLNV